MRQMQSWTILATCLLAIGLLAQSAGAVTIYGADNAPPVPKAEELEQRDSVTQYGITWKFDKKVPVGQFVNGDYYVVGPVTVVEIDPKPVVGQDVADSELDKNELKRAGLKRVRNGSMLNPPANLTAAYDSGLRGYFAPELISLPPYAMKPGDSLVSTISLKLKENTKFVYHSSGARAAGDNSPLKVAAVLTCLGAPQPADAFRPGFTDRQQKVYLGRNLKRDLLPKLARVKGAPEPVKFAEVFQKLWLDNSFFGFGQPMENMPHYGQWVGQSVSNAGLLLCLDFKPEEKEPLLLNFVQVGIDYWGLVKSGHRGWEGWGGHGSGRKFPIVFAGLMLGDEEMAAPTKKFPKVEFGEDNQTRYGECWTGAKVVFAGHSGIQTASGKSERKQWGPYEHMHPSLWDQPGQSNNQSEAYRRSNTSCCWVGEALAMRILKLEKGWNHDAFFDYVDRWMTEDDRPAREQIHKYFLDPNLVNDSKVWCHEGYTGEDWIKEMWGKYRSLSSEPIDGWKKEKQNPDGCVMPKAMAADPNAKPHERKKKSGDEAKPAEVKKDAAEKPAEVKKDATEKPAAPGENK